MTCTRCHNPNLNPYLRKRKDGTREPHKWCKDCMRESIDRSNKKRRQMIRLQKGITELQASIHELKQTK